VRRHLKGYEEIWRLYWLTYRAVLFVASVKFHSLVALQIGQQAVIFAQSAVRLCVFFVKTLPFWAT
jgi:hypothetical protein